VAPRPYQPVERQKTVDAGRARIIAAATELLRAEDAESFSIEAVARRAGVARMTIYNQFESKAGLLEALFDSLVEGGAFGQMPDVFEERDPLLALDKFVGVFGRFWTTHRRVHRRLQAAAMQDVELATALTARNERRRRGIKELVRRVGKKARPPLPAGEIVNVLFVLLSFRTFDALAGEDRTPDDVVPVMRVMVRTLLGV
jgi:AcrR family transcriptional regulator